MYRIPLFWNERLLRYNTGPNKKGYKNIMMKLANIQWKAATQKKT